MGNNIIFNKKLEEYNKKYRHSRYKLLKYTKKEVEQFDKLANESIKGTKNYLLNGRKWALIGDTYYEIPKAPRGVWFRNLNVGVKAATCALVGGAVAGGAGYGIYYAVVNKGSQPVKPFSKDDVIVDPEVSEVAEVKDAKKDEKGNEVITVVANEPTKYVEELEVAMGEETLKEGKKSEGGQYSYDAETGTATVYVETVEENPNKKVRLKKAVVSERPKVTAIEISNEEETKTVAVGEQLHFKAVCKPSLAIQTVTWSLGNKSNAANSIDKNTGVFDAKVTGDDIIKATAIDGSKVFATFNVIVTGKVKESVTIENAPASEIKVGSGGVLTATTTPAGLPVKWSSSNTEVVEINENSGVYKAMGSGEADITVTTPNGASDKCTISVAAEKVTKAQFAGKFKTMVENFEKTSSEYSISDITINDVIDKHDPGASIQPTKLDYTGRKSCLLSYTVDGKACKNPVEVAITSDTIKKAFELTKSESVSTVTYSINEDGSIGYVDTDTTLEAGEAIVSALKINQYGYVTEYKILTSEGITGYFKISFNGAPSENTKELDGNTNGFLLQKDKLPNFAGGKTYTFIADYSAFSGVSIPAISACQFNDKNNNLININQFAASISATYQEESGGLAKALVPGFEGYNYNNLYFDRNTEKGTHTSFTKGKITLIIKFVDTLPSAVSNIDHIYFVTPA